MSFKDLQDFIEQLDKKGELKRIKEPVDPVLEATEIADRLVKSGGPAVLFENPIGAKFPLFMNGYGTWERTLFSLGVKDIEEISGEIVELMKPEIPAKTAEKIKMLGKLTRLNDMPPKMVKKAPCQEVVKTGKDVKLSELPVNQCWPDDGGRYFTLPLVITKDPETGVRNCGMYRLQIYDETTTGMHWHRHKGGAKHYMKAEAMGKPLEIAVAVGPDPAVTYASTAPLPEDIDEFLFAGFLRKKPVELVKCKTVDLEVPANSQFVIEGVVRPHERRLEGPFGDHTGFYSLADDYPVFEVKCITHRKDAIYPATIVGRPPMEDCYLGKATERIFLPLLKAVFTDIVDINMPFEGVFHNMVLVSIDKRYPGHAFKVMNGLWGSGQMAFAKVIIIVDKDVNVQDPSEVAWKALNHIDPQRDIIFTKGPVDVLDHASQLPTYGSKMGVDATKKMPDEGFTRGWPDEIKMTDEIKILVDKKWKKYGID
ncbi:MAG: menaquinone biosynthesis decarboxylase [Acidobacteria bacterium]|nr:menaquinone biosynthesis decarboxylase [Acidobacteriota bacterium]